MIDHDSVTTGRYLPQLLKSYIFKLNPFNTVMFTSTSQTGEEPTKGICIHCIYIVSYVKLLPSYAWIIMYDRKRIGEYASCIQMMCMYENIPLPNSNNTRAIMCIVYNYTYSVDTIEHMTLHHTHLSTLHTLGDFTSTRHFIFSKNRN